MPKTDWEWSDWFRARMLPPGTKEPEATSWYRVEAATKKGKKKTVTVYVFDEISPWGASPKTFAQQVAGLEVDEIDLHINSPGGLFTDGIAIMNMLKTHKAHVTATIDGLAASAASLVAMGADTVVALKGSQIMIHEASGLVYGPAADMTSMADYLEKTNGQMAGIYAEKAGGDADSWLKAMSAETWYTGEEAVAAGLADRLDPTAAEEDVVAARTKFDLSVFAHAGRDKAPAPYTPTAGPPGDKENEEDEEMPNKTLVSVATALGVKDADKLADDAAVEKAIADHRDAEAKAAEAKEGAGGKEPTDTPNVKVPKGFLLVDESTIADLQASGKKADAAWKEMAEQKRDAALDAAIAQGKIPTARREHWQTFWDNDPEGAKTALAALPDNLVPLAPIGRDGNDADEATDPDYRALYPEGAGFDG